MTFDYSHMDSLENQLFDRLKYSLLQEDIKNTYDNKIKKLKAEWCQKWLNQKWLNEEEVHSDVDTNSKGLDDLIAELKKDKLFSTKSRSIVQELKSFTPYYPLEQSEIEKWKGVNINEKIWNAKLSTLVEKLNLEKAQSQQTDNTNTSSEELSPLVTIIRRVGRLIWVVVVVIILIQIVGNLSLGNIKQLSDPDSDNKKEVVRRPDIPQDVVNAEVAKALSEALAASRENAKANLDEWQEGVIARIDDPFLEEYYGYFNQLQLGLKGTWIQLTSESDKEKAGRLISDFQERFTKQVMQPTIMQAQMERYLQEAVKTYTSKATEKLEEVRSKYDIPQPKWGTYLEDLGTITLNSGGQNQDLSLRALSRGGTFLATTTLLKAAPVIGTKTAIGAAGSKAVTKLATKAATKVGAKTLGGTASLVGLELLNPIVGVGVLAWDVWDHYNTVSVEKPKLREKLVTYIDELKYRLLNDSENGLLSSINKFHYEVMDNNLSEAL